ncbi:hypothetical protein PROFUN_05922 [Planoprotostelium fungivorum]|uniref:Uncharacterized protein n=1 Tax=Planoprotostelium fungivorum TaxID=1890364 RepID=A0A2P6N7L6_9EUKA|nr:hypothetical protein PROFUN_05922 [Planoprotostelium fungivorum]
MFGQIILTLVSLLTGIGPFIADFNKTHVYNPRWPPHAKFHNGQTMSLGLLLGLLTLYYTWRLPSDGSVSSIDSLFTAAITGSIYWLAGMSASFYPGSLAIDPEFGTGFPQLPLFAGAAVGSWVAYILETF